MIHDPNDKVYYVYKRYDKETGEIIYVGKGVGCRYRDKRPSRRSKYFMRYIKKHNCVSTIIQNGMTETEAYDLEEQIIEEYKSKGQCKLNFDNGGRRGGRAPGEINGMWGKTHTPEAIAKMKAANQDNFGIKNNNARKCQILDLNKKVLYQFDCVIDLTNKLIEFISQQNGQPYTFSSMRTRVDQFKNLDKPLFNQYYIKIFRKNHDNTVPSLDINQEGQTTIESTGNSRSK